MLLFGNELVEQADQSANLGQENYFSDFLNIREQMGCGGADGVTGCSYSAVAIVLCVVITLRA